MTATATMDKCDLARTTSLAANGETVVMRCLFGSRLYGVAKADSDIDMRAVYLPSARTLLMGSRDATKRLGGDYRRRGAGEADVSGYSLRAYLGLLGALETNAVEMLFAASTVGAGEILDPVFDRIVERRDALLAGTARSAIEHARAQLGDVAPRRAARLEVMEEALAILADCQTSRPMECPRTMERFAAHPAISLTLRGLNLPDQDWTPEMGRLPGRSVFIGVRGRMIDARSSTQIAIDTIERPVRDVAERVRRIAENSARFDLKGLYHGVRLIGQAVELYETRALRFPRPDAGLLMDIREGRLGLDEVGDLISASLEKLEVLEATAPFPAEQDTALAETILIDAHLAVIRKSYPAR